MLFWKSLLILALILNAEARRKPGRRKGAEELDKFHQQIDFGKMPKCESPIDDHSDLHRATKISHELLCISDGRLTTAYSVEDKYPVWSAYVIPGLGDRKGEGPGGFGGGRANFGQDKRILPEDQPRINDKSIFTGNGHGQGFDKGHVAPGNILSWDKSPGGPFDFSYKITNIAPQHFKFNGGSWTWLEQSIKRYADNLDTPLYIVTGTAIDTKLGRSDANGATIPDFYYTLVCNQTERSSMAQFGRNMNEKVPEGMEKPLTIQEFEDIYWVKDVFDGHILPKNCYDKFLNIKQRTAMNKANKGSKQGGHWRKKNHAQLGDRKAGAPPLSPHHSTGLGIDSMWGWGFGFLVLFLVLLAIYFGLNKYRRRRDSEDNSV